MFDVSLSRRFFFFSPNNTTAAKTTHTQLAMKTQRTFKALVKYSHNDGKEYGPGCPAGDLVTTHHNLVTLFPNLFQEVTDGSVQQAAPVARPLDAPGPLSGAAVIETENPTPSKLSALEDAPAALGEDVTARFSKAKASGFKVFKRSAGAYFVADEDNPLKALNRAVLTSRDAVDAFVKQL